MAASDKRAAVVSVCFSGVWVEFFCGVVGSEGRVSRQEPNCTINKVRVERSKPCLV